MYKRKINKTSKQSKKEKRLKLIYYTKIPFVKRFDPTRPSSVAYFKLHK